MQVANVGRPEDGGGQESERKSGRISMNRAEKNLEGYLKKGEFKAPTECGCFPMRERRFKDHYVVLDTMQGGLFYAKSKGQIKSYSQKIPFADIKKVEMVDGDHSTRFRVFLKVSVQPKYKGRDHFTWSAIDHRTALEWVNRIQNSAFLQCNVYTVGDDYRFPERKFGVEPKTAICFSGGGARAHTCAVGQLRALHLLGLLDNESLSYVSSVSGSSWATAIYTFYRDGAKDDNELFGPRTKLDNLNMHNLSRHPPPLGKVATRDMWKLAESLFWSTDYREWWETTVGQVFLEPFGLNDDAPYAHFMMREWIQIHNKHMDVEKIHMSREGRPFWVANAAILGPGWGRAKDVVPIQFTPIYSGTPVMHKLHVHKKKHDHHDSATEVVIGGGMIDSFAFGSEEPLTNQGKRASRLSLKEGAMLVANAAGNMVRDMFKFVESKVADHVGMGDSEPSSISVVQVPFPERPLTLRHTVGISSHGAAYVFKNHTLTERLNPRSLYWSPQNTESESQDDSEPGEDGVRGSIRSSVEAHQMDFADGGTLDNIGLLPMIQRKVRRIMVCVNSEIEVPLKPRTKNKTVRRSVKTIRKRVSASREDLSGKAASVAEDDDSSYIEEEEIYLGEAVSFIPSYDDWQQASILPLFGIEVPKKGEYGTFAHNQVFKREKILAMLEEFQRCKLNGEPCIAVDTYEVMRNDWWGIEGGFSVTIMWYYLEKTRNFELQLPTETMDEIDRGLKGSFPRFPRYKTFGTKKGKWIEPSLSNEQANLLASLTEWSFLRNADRIKSFLHDESVESETVLLEENRAALENLKLSGFA